MIKVETNEGRVDIEMEGAFIEILSETCAILNSIYGGMPEHLREEFAREIHDETAPGGLCWMTKTHTGRSNLRYIQGCTVEMESGGCIFIVRRSCEQRWLLQALWM